MKEMERKDRREVLNAERIHCFTSNSCESPRSIVTLHPTLVPLLLLAGALPCPNVWNVLYPVLRLVF